MKRICIALGLAVTLLNSTPAEEFHFNEDGWFGIVQITDLHAANTAPKPRSENFIRSVLEIYKPHLVIMTGDNVNERSGKEEFVPSIEPYVKIFCDTETRFAVAFGNHDSVKEGDEYYTRDEQYQLYGKMGGDFFVAYDVPELSGTGNGFIPLKDAKTGESLFNIFIMDSHAYVKGGFDGLYSDQIAWYEQVSGSTPVLWFQHIPVPDFYDTGLIIEVPEGTPGATFSNRSKYTKKWFLLDSTRTSGFLKVPPYSTKRDAYNDEKHTFEGRTLYQSWLKMGNIKGAFFGHDHSNSAEGVDRNGIRMGYTKSATLVTGNDNNPGCRLFIVRNDGTYTTQTITEYDLPRARDSRTIGKMIMEIRKGQ